MKVCVSKVLWTCIVLCCLSVCLDARCSADKNRFWNKRKMKCVPCRGCKLGKARNSSEVYSGPTGRYGDEKCRQCRKPPDGYYVGIVNGQSEFQPCVIDCDYVNRQTQTPCTDVSDAVCGACLHGFAEVNDNSQYPCERQHGLPSVTIVDTSNLTVEETTAHASNTNVTVKVDKSSSSTSIISIWFVAVFEVLLCCVTVIVQVVKHKCRLYRRKRFQVVNDDSSDPDTDGPSDLVQMSLPPPDLHLPAAHDSVHDRLIQTSQNTRHHIRSNPAIHQRNSLRRAFSSDSDSDFEDDRNCMCECRQQNTCYCEPNNRHFKDHIVTKDDHIIDLIADGICHLPVKFFKRIGLPDNYYFQYKSQYTESRECYAQCLRRWVEVKGLEAHAGILVEALHAAKFHMVNDTIRPYLTETSTYIPTPVRLY